MENLKVFELAKQMGIETIALMDKLREFKIPVKSHMAELDADTLQLIKARFDEEKAKASLKSAKTTRTKKAATAAAPKVAKAAPSKAEEPAAAKPARAKTVAKAAAPKASSPKTASAKSTQAAKVVIRRKANAIEPELTAQEAEAQEEAPVAEDLAPAGTETVETQPAPIDSTPGIKTTKVISRIDLRTTMGESAPRSTVVPRPSQVAKPQAPAPTEIQNREEIEKLIKQEALAQARKAAALARETKTQSFIAADFKKREVLFQPKKKKTLTGRAALKTQITKPGEKKRRIKIEGVISVSALAQAMGIKATLVIKQLINMGSMVTVNDVLDFETAQIVAQEHGFEVENVVRSEEQLLSATTEANPANLTERPPVVTIMGHVDHGKTSLLDAIRKTNVASGEAGGITQHIGAYSVDVNGRKITFLDTPGHEAFTAMRARGAKVTDIVVLVVSADDGVMPQTKEAIIHAKSAGVPIIVAINKMDLPGANPQKVMQALTEFELVSEEWGGTTIMAKVSAAKKQGIKELLEMILLQAEVLELKADPKAPAQGTVIEARLDKGRGPVATLLVSQGTLRTGDIVVVGTTFGKVRAMLNDKGSPVKDAPPGAPVEILGLQAVPMAGDLFSAAKTEELAREVAEKRLEKLKSTQAAPAMKMSLEDLFAKAQSAEIKELAILIKADVQGSAEALKELLLKIPADKVKLKIIGAAVGGISESDVLLASATSSIIIGFNVRPESGVAQIAAREGVEIKTYSIIYDVADDIKKAMTGLLAPSFVEKALGRAEVRSLFNVPKVGTIAGCAVIDGKITRQAHVRLLRESRIVYEGKLSSLKRFKDDVREVQNGYECGIGIENYNDLKVGDVIEAYMKEAVAQTI
ncbi:MAG: translation initiation factor IF-2 [Oligoflexia bacterium]|nr:translation initiation factor IF-2 [Oligoflexia bacterium]